MSTPPLQSGANAGAAARLIDVLRDGEPDEALLREAVADAGALVGPVLAALGWACSGEELDEASARLAFFGVHVLAAAGRIELWRPVLAGLRLPGEALDQLFGDAVTETMPSVLIAVFDGDAAPAAALVADPQADGAARWTVGEVLAELAVQGRIDRQVAVDALRAAATALGDDGAAWLGWHEAVLRLRAAELVPLARSLWDELGDELFEGEAEAVRGEFAALEADPSSPPPESIRPFEPLTDPAVALAFTSGEDAAAEVMLVPDELVWLAGFLASPACRSTAMNLEALDGFLTGVITGPSGLDFETILELILGGGFRPGARVAKADRKRFEDLIERHLTTIDLRLGAGQPTMPLLLPPELAGEAAGAAGEIRRPVAGQAWAAAFVLAMQQFDRDWNRAIAESEAVSEPVLLITALASAGTPAAAGGDLPDDVLEDAFEWLPTAVEDLYVYWREVEEEREAARQEPVRSEKVGRNAPCPCGSGKKYKRCCGAAA